jgi:hypothetical protein
MNESGVSMETWHTEHYHAQAEVHRPPNGLRIQPHGFPERERVLDLNCFADFLCRNGELSDFDRHFDIRACWLVAMVA